MMSITLTNLCFVPLFLAVLMENSLALHLLDQCKTSMDLDGTHLSLISLSADVRICSPPFMVLNSECGPDTLEQIKQHGLTFPFSKFPPFPF